MRDHKRTQHLVFYTRRAFVHTARPFPSFRDIILARTLSTFRISVNMCMFTHSLALSLSHSHSLDTDGWIPTRVGRERRGRRRAVQTVADISSFVVMSNVTPNVSTSFSLFRSAHCMLPVVFVPLLVVAGATTVLQLSFASCCVSNERSIHRRRDDVNAGGKTTQLSGGKSASESSLGAVNVVFKPRAKGAASRATGRNGTPWKSSWTRAPSRAFARYV